MKTQPICPPEIRPSTYFTTGSTLYHILVDGSIFEIEIHSVPTNGDSFYYRVDPSSVTPCKLTSPAILSARELSWLQKILKDHPEINSPSVLTVGAQNGDTDAIIFIGFILAVRNLYKKSSGYDKGFVGRLIASLREIKIPEVFTSPG